MIILILILLQTRIQGNQIRIPPNARGIAIDQALKLKAQLACNIEVTRDGTGVIVYPEPDCAKRQALSDAAWNVIHTRCTRCHGETGPPADTALTFEAIRAEVGNLDMRTKEGILQGGRRGPALKPGNLFGSLIFLFASRCQVCALEIDMSGHQLPPLRDLQSDAINAGFALVPPDSSEDSVGMPPFWQLPELELAALRDWIIAGAP
jgi:hypothetical protein